MGARQVHAAALAALPVDAWEGYLTERSGLPGPRANLELLWAVGDVADPPTLRAWAGSADEYLACCGAAGLGGSVRGAADADAERLRALADDGRWRVREGVAMALQRLGDRDPEVLREVLTSWAADGSPLVLRAAAAGVCEPRLLHDPATVRCALDVLDAATACLTRVPSGRRRDAGVRTLRQGLAYCWSVAVAADPLLGLPRFTVWAAHDDADVRWLVRENVHKARLIRVAPEAVAALTAALA